jgi:hypothetical protein
MNFYLACHTFTTAVTLKNGVPVEAVSRMPGHEKPGILMIYTEVDEGKMVEDMADTARRLNR